MPIRVVRADQLTEADLERWDAAQDAAPDLRNPFLSARFAVTAARFRERTRVAVVEDGDGRRGWFPYEHGALGIGAPLGAGLTDAQGMVHEAGLRCDPAELLRACGLRLWRFDHLTPAAAPFGPAEAVTGAVTGAGAGAGGGVVTGAGARSLADRLLPSPVLDLSAGYDTYFKGLRERSASTCRTTLSRARRLERDAGPLRFVFDSDDTAALDALMGWKSAQYRRTGRADRFAREDVVGLVRALAATRARHCTGTLSVLYAGDRPVAAHFGPRSAGTLAYWFPAYDTEFGRYSPGMILVLRMAEAAAAAGLETIDLGKGDQPYKDKLASGALLVAEGALTRPSPVTALVRGRDRAVRAAEDVVLANPRLRAGARRALEYAGTLRGRAAALAPGRSRPAR